MCDDVTVPQDEGVAAVTGLCPTYWKCLSEGLTDPDSKKVAKKVFKAFRASYCVQEPSYFDIDFRSEFGLIQETTLSAENVNTTRLHFFTDAVSPQGRSVYEYLQSVAQRTGTSQPIYLGYTIIRGNENQSIGRSMIAPRIRPRQLLQRESLAEHIQTASIDTVTLFGTRLSVLGVPFMAQDGDLLRCAHVAAWMTHYTAVLRGLVPRRASGEFHTAASLSPSSSRSFPSRGLTIDASIAMLEALDLPAISFTEYDPSTSRRSWTDQQIQGGDPEKIERRFTADVCRYLNSGHPPILYTEEHARMVCGYLHERDLTKIYRNSDRKGSDVAALIVNDDDVGPFQIVPVSEFTDGMMNYLVDRTSETALLVPLPRGLWASGEDAEQAGLRAIRKHVDLRVSSLEETGGTRAVPSQLRKIWQASSGKQATDGYSVRTFALPSNDFKVDFARRIQDDGAAAVCGYTQMAKYVWVVEVLDDRLRKRNRPAVRCTAVIDASVGRVRSKTAPPVFMLHIPGYIASFSGHPEGVLDSDQAQPEPWRCDITHTEPYESGRWNAHHPALASSEAARSRARGATTS